MFGDVLCFLAFLLKIIQLFDVDSVEKCRHVRASFGNFFVVAQVVFAVNLPLKAVNDGLVAVDGFLDN